MCCLALLGWRWGASRAEPPLHQVLCGGMKPSQAGVGATTWPRSRGRWLALDPQHLGFPAGALRYPGRVSRQLIGHQSTGHISPRCAEMGRR